MTCIAAAVKNNELWMGCDGISLHRHDNVKIAAEPKIFQRGEMLIGVSGTIHCRQIIQYLLDVPAVPPEADLIEWMVKGFATPLREAMKAHGGEIKNREGNDEMDARLLIGLRGGLLEVDTGYGVYCHAAPFAAIGCADQEANAAMFTANGILGENGSGDAIVRYGLAAASKFDSNIRPPFTILKLGES